MYIHKESELMVRTVNNHYQEEEEDDEDFISRTTDGSSQKDGRRNDQKASSNRSKHSETEQRRRSKINERFQILRDLIPQNDQKRDRASFLLEVIQYIQFLQEKLQVYEGTYQGWSPEPTKLMPWRGNCGADQSQAIKNGSVDEGNIVLTNAQNVDFSGSAHGAVSVEQNTFEAEPSHICEGSFPDVEVLGSQPWNGEGGIQSCTQSEMEELKIQREEASISNAYSKGLLNNLTQALGYSGVDLSQARISVEFDIRKGRRFGMKDEDEDEDFVCQATTQAQKRLRTEPNQ